MQLLAWLLPFFSGLLDAGHRIISGKSRVGGTMLSAAGFLLPAPLYLLLALSLEETPTFPQSFFFYLILHGVFLSMGIILMIEAHKVGELSLVSPLATITPGFMLIVSPLFGNQQVNFLGGIGVLIITVGLYLMGMKANGEKRRLLDPLKALFSDKGARLMFLSSLVFTIPASIDPIGIAAVGPFHWLTLCHPAAGFFSIILGFIRKDKDLRPKEFSRAKLSSMLLVASFLTFSSIAYVFSFELLNQATYPLCPSLGWYFR